MGAPASAAPAASGGGAATVGIEAPDRWTAGTCWGLGFLTLISVFNYLDRSLLGLVLPLIKADLQLSDTALGLISGLAFALFYSLLGLPIASLADRASRRNIIAVGFGFWSLMTVLTGFVANAWQMALCRFLMGAGEAAGNAPSQAMIADLVNRARRPLALSIFTTASAIDSLIFLPAAGWAADQYGWRMAFHVSGLIGMALALLFFLTVPEPPRRDVAADAVRMPILTALRILTRSRSYLFLLAGVSCMGGTLYATGTWTTSMLTRVHGYSVSEVATVVTPLRGIVGAIGVVAAGWLADRLGRRDPRWRLWMPALCCALCAAGFVAFLLSDVPVVWIAGLGIVSALYAAYQGPTFAAAISMVPPGMRAVSVSVVVLFTSLVGQVFGPLTVGALSDALTPAYGDDAIRYAMLVLAPVTLAGGLCFLAAARPDRASDPSSA